MVLWSKRFWWPRWRHFGRFAVLTLTLSGCHGWRTTPPVREQLTWPADGAVLEQVRGSMLMGEAAGVAADAVPAFPGGIAALCGESAAAAPHSGQSPTILPAAGSWPGWSARQLAALRGEDPPPRDESQP